MSEVTFDEFKRLDMRIGTVMDVERIPRTERLYKIIVDLGDLGKRQTVSSLVGYYACLLYTSPSPRDRQKSRMPSSA